MIHKISVENFYSIAERQELVFEVPKNAPDLPCFKPSLCDPEKRLPASIGFFGANASGKTTLLRAIVSLVCFARYSFDWQPNAIGRFFQAYRQKAWWDQPTKITLEYEGTLSENAPSALFRYELHIANQPDNFLAKTIIYEALSYAPNRKFKMLFKRENQDIYFGQEFGISNNNDPRKEIIRPDAGILSTLAKLNHPLSIYLSQISMRINTNIIGVNKIHWDFNETISLYAKDKNCLDRLNKELRRLDVGIESMTVEQSQFGLLAKFTHTGLDSFIFLDEESSGTQSFIKIFLHLYYVLETGGIAVIDEIDTDLHPLLFPELFRWFSDPKRNPKHAQLFFTAHNPELLNYLEKEQVFFTEKMNGKFTHLYGAAEIKGLRREPSLMKKYLSGELGAIPHIG